ncbi:MAG: hypothetical protein H8K05_15245 [Nitrospira sp.]|nr:hypothetical protein [Nitrospira sp.]
MRRIVVNIDSLVLKGFRYEDRHAIAQGLQEEISRALSIPDAAARVAEFGSVPNFRLGNVRVEVGTKLRQVGAATGRAVGEGLLK